MNNRLDESFSKEGLLKSLTGKSSKKIDITKIYLDESGNIQSTEQDEQNRQ
jgi:hypothetical protein